LLDIVRRNFNDILKNGKSFKKVSSSGNDPKNVLSPKMFFVQERVRKMSLDQERVRKMSLDEERVH